MSIPYLILIEYLSNLDDVRSVKFNHNRKAMVTNSDQKFEPLILCLHPITFITEMIFIKRWRNVQFSERMCKFHDNTIAKALCHNLWSRD